MVKCTTGMRMKQVTIRLESFSNKQHLTSSGIVGRVAVFIMECFNLRQR